jgi:hypothetical protein
VADLMKSDEAPIGCSSPYEDRLSKYLVPTNKVGNECSIDSVNRSHRRTVNKCKGNGRQHPVPVHAVDRRNDFTQIIVGDALSHL